MHVYDHWMSATGIHFTKSSSHMNDLVHHFEAIEQHIVCQICLNNDHMHYPMLCSFN